MDWLPGNGFVTIELVHDPTRLLSARVRCRQSHTYRLPREHGRGLMPYLQRSTLSVGVLAVQERQQVAASRVAID
jgi:hypothetical protein